MPTAMSAEVFNRMATDVARDCGLPTGSNALARGRRCEARRVACYGLLQLIQSRRRSVAAGRQAPRATTGRVEASCAEYHAMTSRAERLWRDRPALPWLGA